MAKRYFYTDPLKAAWMARCHRMEFLGIPYREGFHNDRFGANRFEFLPLTKDVWKYSIPKFYIHPDSLRILEPRRMDICIKHLGGGMVMLEFFDGTEPESVWEIVRRGGEAFFWPECEEE